MGGKPAELSAAGWVAAACSRCSWLAEDVTRWGTGRMQLQGWMQWPEQRLHILDTANAQHHTTPEPWRGCIARASARPTTDPTANPPQAPRMAGSPCPLPTPPLPARPPEGPLPPRSQPTEEARGVASSNPKKVVSAKCAMQMPNLSYQTKKNVSPKRATRVSTSPHPPERRRSSWRRRRSQRMPALPPAAASPAPPGSNTAAWRARPPSSLPCWEGRAMKGGGAFADGAEWALVGGCGMEGRAIQARVLSVLTCISIWSGDD